MSYWKVIDKLNMECSSCGRIFNRKQNWFRFCPWCGSLKWMDSKEKS